VNFSYDNKNYRQAEPSNTHVSSIKNGFRQGRFEIVKRVGEFSRLELKEIVIFSTYFT